MGITNQVNLKRVWAFPKKKIESIRGIKHKRYSLLLDLEVEGTAWQGRQTPVSSQQGKKNFHPTTMKTNKQEEENST